MGKLITAYRRSPLRLVSHAWAVLGAAALATFLLLPHAQRLYNGDHPLAGFLLHRLLLVLFLLAAVMSGLSLAAQLWVGLTRRDRAAAARLGNIATGLLLAAPALLLAGAMALLLLIGRHLGLALG